MSLLNQVLQDLDRRAVPLAQRPLHIAHQTPARQAAEAPADPSAFDRWRWSSWGLVAMAGIAAAWVYLQPAAEPVVVAPAPSRPVTGPVATVDPMPAAAIASTTDRAAGSSNDGAEPAAIVPDSTAVEPPGRTVGGQPVTEASGPLTLEPAPIEWPKRNAGGTDGAGLDDRQMAYLPLKNAGPPAGQAAPDTPTKVKVQSGDRLKPNERARRQIEAGELSAAEETVTQRLAARPGDREARELLVGMMLRGGRYVQALEAINAGLRHHPDHRKFLLIKARLLAQSGDTDGAVTLLEGRLAEGEGSREALQMLGALRQQQGHYDEAVAVYRRLVERAPTTGPAWVGLAIGLDALGDPGALEAYTRALSLGGLPEAAARYARQRRAELGSGNG